ncbi:MAG: hypothetical protein DRP88_02360 [Candidatus Neomarinimicrobiota bacterium]|nr:hypothetical protein [Candidatus Neomarinimicrobiota bacterium]RKY48357.1 MAG: hypothetical protein DRP88_02360 [Candidatus Neomarinimicrobiota bacterium]HDN59042.1 hypothetical protein [Candidatus Neomarinimicrobiota bacterium]
MPDSDEKREAFESFDRLEQRVIRLIKLFAELKEENRKLKEQRTVGGDVSDGEVKEVLNLIKDKVKNLLNMLDEIGI